MQSGVEALLDHGGADALAARVVAVVDREQRPARRDRGGRERSCREVADAARYAADRPRLTSADDVAVGALRGRPPPRSPSNRTIAWSTRPDRIRSRSSRLPMSLGDPAQGLGPMEQVGDLLGALGDR